MSNPKAIADLPTEADPPSEPPIRRGRGPNKVTCTAKSRTTGSRCGQSPIAGGSVCRFHGGRAPQVERKAGLRLAELVMPAIAILAREMVKADKSNDRQRAANSILDRAGITRGQSSEVDVARELLINRLLALKAEGAEADMPELEATVIDDEPKPKTKRATK